MQLLTIKGTNDLQNTLKRIFISLFEDNLR